MGKYFYQSGEISPKLVTLLGCFLALDGADRPNVVVWDCRRHQQQRQRPQLTPEIRPIDVTQ